MKNPRLPAHVCSTIASTFILATCGVGGFAQTPAEDPPENEVELPAFTVDASKDVGYVGTNSLSASRAAIPVVDMPASIIVLTRELIDDIGAADVNDVVRYVSGVSDSSMPAQDSLAFRVRGTGATVSTDGFRSGGEGTQELAEIERVEVLKGPSAILFAKGGSAGATVNRITKRPLEYAQNTLKLQTGLYDANRIEFDSTGPVARTDGKLLYRAVFAAQDDDGYSENVSTKRYILAPSFTYKFSKDTYATLKYSYFWNKQTQYVGVPIDESDPTELRVEEKLFPVSRKRTLNDPNDYQGTFRHRYDFTFGTKLGDRGRMLIGSQFADTIAVRVYTRPSGTPLVEPDGTVPRSWGRVQTHDYRYRLYNDNIFKLDLGPTEHDLVFGVDLAQDGPGDRTNQSFVLIEAGNINAPQTPITSTPVVTAPRLPISEQRTAQLYLMDSLRAFDDRLILSGGITKNIFETDNYNSGSDTWSRIDGDENTVQYGAVVRPVRGVSLYYGYNENFDSQVVPLGRELPDGTVEDAGLAPPRMSVAHEFGVKFSMLQDRLSASVAHFDTDLTNRTQVIIGTPFSRLISGGKFTGWETDIFFRASDQLSLIATYAYTDATDTSGIQIETVAPHTGSLWMRYDFAEDTRLQGLGVSLGCQYQNSYVLNSRGVNLSVDGRTLFDAALYYTWKKYQVQLNVKNLTDKYYIAGGFLPSRVFIGDGRNIKLSLTYTF